MGDTPLSGTQHVLRHGDDEAVIASVGATLRSLRRRGRDLVVPFEADEVRPSFRGATLVPWPNRVVDGRYSFGGADQVLSLSEPARGHALHGLGLWLDWETVEATDDRVTLRTTIQAQTGYPWPIAVETTFALGADGLTQTTTATNLASTPAPYGAAPHPYLRAGDTPLDTWTLDLPAGRVLLADERLIPTELASVEVDAERFDYREPRVLGSVEIDHAYTGLEADDDGAFVARVTAANGSGVQMTWDAACPWVQIHTADLDGDPSVPGYRVGLAVEPMTCAPDAFNSGDGLIVLEPGASTTVAWRISAID